MCVRIGERARRKRERGRKRVAFRAHIFRFLLLPEKTDGRAMADRRPVKVGPSSFLLTYSGPAVSPFLLYPKAARSSRLPPTLSDRPDRLRLPACGSSRYLLAIAGMMRLNQYHQRRRECCCAKMMTTLMTMTTIAAVRFLSCRPRPRQPYHAAYRSAHGWYISGARIICENIPSNWRPIFIVISNT